MRILSIFGGSMVEYFMGSHVLPLRGQRPRNSSISAFLKETRAVIWGTTLSRTNALTSANSVYAHATPP